MAGPLHLAGVHADPRVVDHDAGAVVGRLEVDLDGGVGLGVPGRVVEQFGDGEHDRLHRPADDGEFELRTDLDPPVVADPGLRAAHHVGERGDPALAARPRAAQHGDGLGPAPELGVGVVDLQQVAQHVGVVVAVLHVRDGELLLVGQALQRADGALERGLGGLVGAAPGPPGGGRALLQDAPQVLREVRSGQPPVGGDGVGGRAGRQSGVGAVVPGCDRRQVDGGQQAGFLVPCADGLLQVADPLAEDAAPPPLPDQERDEDEGGGRQEPRGSVRYVWGHQILVAGVDPPMGDRPRTS